jgi:hypothetical protein
VIVYAIPVIFLAQRILRLSTGLTITFILGTLTIFSTVVRFVTLKVGTGQENLVCKCLGYPNEAPAKTIS